MKKILYNFLKNDWKAGFLFLLLFLGLISVSCNKVGADDPALSLNSRENRLLGEWLLNRYTLTESIIQDINFSFNTLLCDTGNINKLQALNKEIESNYTDSILTSKFVETDGGIGLTKIFVIELIYNLNIKKDGIYTCSGTYEYQDNVQEATITGSFETQNGAWFWEQDTEEKAAVTFLNFPIINIQDLEANNSPIERVNSKTFELLRLASRNMKLEEKVIFEDKNTVSFSPYIISLSDTIFSCTQFREVINKVDSYGVWTFKQ